MVGGVYATTTLKKLQAGDIVELLLNADLGTLQFSVNACVEVSFQSHSYRQWETALSFDFCAVPGPLYTCILFDKEDQSVEVLQSELTEGLRLGDAIGGDIILRSALNALSEQFWKREKVNREQREYLCRLCAQYTVMHGLFVKQFSEQTQLQSVGNGAVCSAFLVWVC